MATDGTDFTDGEGSDLPAKDAKGDENMNGHKEAQVTQKGNLEFNRTWGERRGWRMEDRGWRERLGCFLIWIEKLQFKRGS